MPNGPRRHIQCPNPLCLRKFYSRVEAIPGKKIKNKCGSCTKYFDIPEKSIDE